MVRPAGASDVVAVQAVSLAAGERFRSNTDRRIAERADDPPPADAELRAAAADGRLWVATDGDVVVGFVLAAFVDGCAHVEEVSVHPDHEGRGHGSALLDVVSAWAVDEGLSSVTLTTYRDVAWNRPFYERRGFRVLDEQELTPGLRAVRDHEATLGLVPELRVVMRRSLPGGAG